MRWIYMTDKRQMVQTTNMFTLTALIINWCVRCSSDLVVENLSVARSPSTKPKYGPARKGAKAVKSLTGLTPLQLNEAE